MLLELVAQGWLADLRYRGRSPQTLRWYEDKLHHILPHWQGVDVESITPPQIREFLLSLPGGDETVHGYYRALRALHRWGAREWDLPNPMAKVRAPKVERKLQPRLSTQELSLLEAACGRDKLGIRNRAIVILLMDTGIRATELLKLKVDDFDSKSGWIVIERGKGGKGRVVPLSGRAVKAVIRWIGVRGKPLTPALFLRLTRGDAPLSYPALRQMLDRLEEKTGVKCNPHKFRHTFASRYAGRGNLLALQKILGHTSLEMVRRYAELDMGQVTEDYRRTMG